MLSLSHLPSGKEDLPEKITPFEIADDKDSLDARKSTLKDKGDSCFWELLHFFFNHDSRFWQFMHLIFNLIPYILTFYACISMSGISLTAEIEISDAEDEVSSSWSVDSFMLGLYTLVRGLTVMIISGAIIILFVFICVEKRNLWTLSVLLEKSKEQCGWVFGIACLGLFISQASIWCLCYFEYPTLVSGAKNYCTTRTSGNLFILASITGMKGTFALAFYNGPYYEGIAVHLESLRKLKFTLTRNIRKVRNIQIQIPVFWFDSALLLSSIPFMVAIQENKTSEEYSLAQKKHDDLGWDWLQDFGEEDYEDLRVLIHPESHRSWRLIADKNKAYQAFQKLMECTQLESDEHETLSVKFFVYYQIRQEITAYIMCFSANCLLSMTEKTLQTITSFEAKDFVPKNIPHHFRKNPIYELVNPSQQQGFGLFTNSEEDRALLQISDSPSKTDDTIDLIKS